MLLYCCAAEPSQSVFTYNMNDTTGADNPEIKAS
jgi:hypothetical protein